MKRGLLVLALALALLLYQSPAALALVEQSESFYTADDAGVLSPGTEEAILQANGLLESQCQGAQLVVVTVDYLNGMYADEYAYELFNDWGVGSDEENNGMLLLLGVQEGKGWLAYGLGLDGLTEEQVDAWLEAYFWEDFDRGDYDAAVNNLLPVLMNWYGETYGVNLGSAPESMTQVPDSAGSTGQRRNSISGFITVFLVIVILAFLCMMPVRLFRHRSWGWGWRFRRTPPPPPPPMGGPGPFRGAPPPRGFGQNRPPTGASPPSSPPRNSGFSPRGMGGGGRGGRPGGSSDGSRPSGRGGGGFSGGGGGRR